LLAVLIGSRFMLEHPWPVMAVFVLFMSGMAIRGVAAQALLSHVPEPARRASFMSLQSATQHFASGSAAVVSAWLLFEQPDKSLGNVPLVAGIFLVCVMLAPMVMMRIQRRLNERERPPALGTGDVSV
jgi:predicted MFS family arabinose efflux permease